MSRLKRLTLTHRQQYGEERLEVRGETFGARCHHLAYYVAWTETSDAGLRGPDELHWHQAYVAEWSNLRNALRWACEVDDGDSACRLLCKALWRRSRVARRGELVAHR